MAKISLNRHILALTDEELEQFVRDWVARKKDYTEVVRFSGAGDLGRDVVGYHTGQRHEGSWHNYQCKQHGRTLPTSNALTEIGKILYHSFNDEFTAPTKYFFVAPRGVNRNIKRLIAKPTEFKNALVERWEECCATSISDGKDIALTPALRAFIQAWDFSKIQVIGVDEILGDDACKPVLHSWFGVDPGPPPSGVVPASIEDHEMPYVEQLLGAYGEREHCTFTSYNDVTAHSTHGPHLHMQRERYFDADAFSRFYRDNTLSQEVDSFRRDMRHGIAEIYSANHADALCRLDAVMSQAAVVHPAGILARHASVPVKQGICHHFANEGELRWRKK